MLRKGSLRPTWMVNFQNFDTKMTLDAKRSFPVVINFLHPKISIYILHTLLYTFPLVLMRTTHLSMQAS